MAIQNDSKRILCYLFQPQRVAVVVRVQDNQDLETMYSAPKGIVILLNSFLKIVYIKKRLNSAVIKHPRTQRSSQITGRLPCSTWYRRVVSSTSTLDTSYIFYLEDEQLVFLSPKASFTQGTSSYLASIPGYYNRQYSYQLRQARPFLPTIGMSLEQY